MKYNAVLKNFRQQIDQIDKEILFLFAKRFEISEAIGKIKKENNLPILDMERFNILLEKLKKEGKMNNLDENFVGDIWNRVHRESLSKQ
jgi:chorismate mutase